MCTVIDYADYFISSLLLAIISIGLEQLISYLAILIHSCPGAAGAAGIKDKTGLAMLEIGLPIQVLVEAVLVTLVWVKAVSPASAEATATRAPAATAAATSAAGGLSDWRKGLSRG